MALVSGTDTFRSRQQAKDVQGIAIGIDRIGMTVNEFGESRDGPKTDVNILGGIRLDGSFKGNPTALRWGARLSPAARTAATAAPPDRRWRRTRFYRHDTEEK